MSVPHNSFLDDLPKGWTFDRLKDVVALRNEKTSEATADEDYLELEDIESGTGRILSRRNTLEVDSAVTIFKKGDVLFGKLRPYLEKYYEAEFDGKCTGEILAFKPERIASRFLFYCVGSRWFIERCNALAYGAKMPRVSWPTQLSQFNIPLPPLPEQGRIAAYLDASCAEIDAAVAVKQQQIETLDALRKSIIHKTVTRGLDASVELKDSGVEWIGQVPTHWKVKRIKRFAEVKRGASPRPIADPIYFDDNGEYAWVRIADVSASGRYLEKTTQMLSEIGASLSVKQYPGDLFISIAGTVGKPIITKIKCCIHDGFIWFDKPRFNKDFIYFIFSSEAPYQGLGKLGTQLNLNTDTIGQIFIPAPPDKEQEVIVDFLNKKTIQIDSLIDNINAQITMLEQYRKSLIHECVTGQRRVTEADVARGRMATYNH